MKLWKKDITLEQLNSLKIPTIHNSLGIQFTQMGDDYLEATLPVDSRTHQPAGLLHGGASVVLAESLGSVASLLATEPHITNCVGIEVNACHLNSVKTGTVTGRVRPIKLGKTLHFWQIDISDSEGKPVCFSRLTVMIKSI